MLTDTGNKLRAYFQALKFYIFGTIQCDTNNLKSAIHPDNLVSHIRIMVILVSSIKILKQSSKFTVGSLLGYCKF